jgi:hypothetical protein
MSARFLALIFLLGPALLPACATIGDDLATLRAAYGSAKQVGGQMLFRHGGFSIAVYFDGTRSAMEIFVPDDTPAQKNPKTDFTQKDVDEILALEGGGRPWNSIQTHSGEPTWLTADGKLIARFNPSEKTLAILINSK